MNIAITNKLVTLRSFETEDLTQLAAIYKSTRRKELEQVTEWSDSQKEQFLDQQFAFQHEYYLKNYTEAAFYVMQFEDEIIGRLYIDSNFENKSVRIIDIALLPKWQNKGIGTGILKDIQTEAEKLNRVVSIHVESFNPAMQLYFRLGFKKVSETNGVYFLFEWKPE